MHLEAEKFLETLRTETSSRGTFIFSDIVLACIVSSKSKHTITKLPDQYKYSAHQNITKQIVRELVAKLYEPITPCQRSLPVKLARTARLFRLLRAIVNNIYRLTKYAVRIPHLTERGRCSSCRIECMQLNLQACALSQEWFHDINYCAVIGIFIWSEPL